MNKLKTSIVVAALAVLAFTPAFAGSKVVLPQEDVLPVDNTLALISDIDIFATTALNDDSIWGVGFGTRTDISKSLQLGFNLGYADAEYIENLDENIWIFGVRGYYNLDLGSALVPYSVVGFDANSGDEWEYTYSTGLGLRFDLGTGTSYFLEGNYNFDQDADDFWSARAGVSFNF